MFININNSNFGRTQDKLAVDNVHLPPWASHNPYHFTA
jgi:hypothetical protein